MSKALDFANANLGDGEFASFKLPQGSGDGVAGAIRVDNAGKIEYWSTGSYEDMWREMDEGDLLATMRILLVGGGGGGGTSQNGYGGAGGGGAGGLIHQTAYTFALDTNISFTVGTGAAAITGNRIQGNNGNDTTFGDLTAVGGGGGGGAQTGTAVGNGKSGGSGGGNGYDATGTSGGAGTSGQGNAGGNDGDNYGGGGGGGAGEAGTDMTVGQTTNGPGQPGGDGLAIDITGTSVTYAGGGGGGTYNGSGAAGGAGGGGHGGNYAPNTQAGRDGDDGLGGGGGGASGGNSFDYDTGGAGGDGIIILRIDESMWSPTFSGTHTKTSTTIGNDVIYSITAASNATVNISAA